METAPQLPDLVDWPRLTAALPGISGRLKATPEDFVVEEIPAYEPSGTGEHLFLWIEKRDVAAEQLTRHVARGLGISPRDIGVAGLKDRFAVTRQYVSVPARCAERIPELETDRIRVLKAVPHGNKLRTGHLRGNRFSLLVRDVEPGDAERAEAIAKEIARVGFPNYYGEQRFGRDRETLQLGLDLLTGRQTPRDIPFARRRFLLKFALSAAQSQLFNAVLAERIRDGLLQTVLLGDVMEVVESGGKFVVEDAAVEQPRCDAGEIVPTGPMFGPKMKAPTGVPAEREARVLQEHGLTPEQFGGFSQLLSGTRRALAIRPADLQIAGEPEGLRFEFTLPSGVYATTLLREFLRSVPAGEASGPGEASDDEAAEDTE